MPNIFSFCSSSGFAGGGSNSIIITVDTGSTVYATNGTDTVNGISVDGVCELKGLKAGTWTVWAEKDGSTAPSAEVVVEDEYRSELFY